MTGKTDAALVRIRDATAELADYAEKAEAGMGSVRADKRRAEIIGVVENLVAALAAAAERADEAENEVERAAEGLFETRAIAAEAALLVAQQERDEAISQAETYRKAALVSAEEWKRAEATVTRLRKIAERVDYFGESLIQGEFDAGSPTVAELVEDARAALAQDAETKE